MIYYVHEKWYVISSYSLTYFLIWRTCVADPEDRLVYYMRNTWYIVSITCVYNFGFVQQLAWGGVGLWNFSSHLWIIFEWTLSWIYHCVQSVRIQSYSGPHFFRIFPHSDWILRMREHVGKMRTRITPNTDTFYAVFSKNEVFENSWYVLEISRNIFERFCGTIFTLKDLPIRTVKNFFLISVLFSINPLISVGNKRSYILKNKHTAFSYRFV